MKAKNRKTGEVVDIISYSLLSAAERCPGQDYVSYIDSQGVEHYKEDLNYYWDFEPINNAQSEDTHQQDAIERAAIAALQGLLANPNVFHTYGAQIDIASRAVSYAYDLSRELEED